MELSGFEYCVSLLRIAIPDPVKVLQPEPFRGCDSLFEIMMKQRFFPVRDSIARCFFPTDIGVEWK
jgi:hypothetical protein